MGVYDEKLFIDRESKLSNLDKLLRPETPQAIMIIQAPEQMGKSWLTHKMINHAAISNIHLPVARIDFRDAYDKTKLVDQLSLLRLLRDRLNTPAYFNDFTCFVNESTAPTAPPMGIPAQTQFAGVIVQHFQTVPMLKRFSHPLILWDELRGEIISEKAYSLVNVLCSSGRIEELLTRLEQERSHVPWRETWATVNVAPPAHPHRAGGDLSAVEGVIDDQDRTLPPVTVEEHDYLEKQLNQRFFACLSKLIADRGALLLLFDSFDEAPYETDAWMGTELLPRLREKFLREIVVIVTTRREGPRLSHLKIDDLLVSSDPVPLEPFGEAEARALMQNHKLVEKPPHYTLQGILELTGGNPGKIVALANGPRARETKNDAFFTDP